MLGYLEVVLVLAKYELKLLVLVRVWMLFLEFKILCQSSLDDSAAKHAYKCLLWQISQHSKVLSSCFYFVADDAGFETQVYNNTVCKTPNLNQLAKRSLVFKNAFTSVSSCSPSRCVLVHENYVRADCYDFNSIGKLVVLRSLVLHRYLFFICENTGINTPSSLKSIVDG